MVETGFLFIIGVDVLEPDAGNSGGEKIFVPVFDVVLADELDFDRVEVAGGHCCGASFGCRFPPVMTPIWPLGGGGTLTWALRHLRTWSTLVSPMGLGQREWRPSPLSDWSRAAPKKRSAEGCRDGFGRLLRPAR